MIECSHIRLIDAKTLTLNIHTMDPNSLAVEFICPICHVLPDNPFLAEDGFIYCKGCIENFFRDESKESTSPMTGGSMGKTLIYSDTVKEAIKALTKCDDLDDAILGAWDTKKDVKSTGDIISDIKNKAKHGDIECMVILARWHLFGDKPGVEPDANIGYNWCKMAADQDDAMGKAYQGYCLIRGLGVEKDWEDGYEALVEAASESQESNTGGRDFAAYIIGSCYNKALYGFKHDTKKADKWLNKIDDLGKVQTEPARHLSEFFSDDKEEQIDLHGQFDSEKLLFPTKHTHLYQSSLRENGIYLGNSNTGEQSFEFDQFTATTSSISKSSSSTEHYVTKGHQHLVTNHRTCGTCSNDLSDLSSRFCLVCEAAGLAKYQ